MNKITRLYPVYIILCISLVLVVSSLAIIKGLSGGKDSSASFSFTNSTDFSISDSNIVDIQDGIIRLNKIDQIDDDNSSTGFGGNIHLNTLWTGNSLKLMTGQTSASFTSRVINANSPVSWSNLSWIPKAPYGKELPNNKGKETAYTVDNVNMTSNVLLYHMNETSGSVIDDSGSGNNGKTYGNVVYKESGVFNTALRFNSEKDYVSIPNKASLNPTDKLTLEAWINPGVSNWNYKRVITIAPGTPSADYQVKVEIDKAYFNYVKSYNNGADIRFYDTQGTKLSYWIEKWDTSGTSTMWVKIPKAGTTTFYMYYGNSTATAESNGKSTFIFFDDMETWSGWTKYLSGNVSQDSTYSYSGTYSAHKTTSSDPNGAYIQLPNSLGRDIMLEFWVNRNSTYVGGGADRIGVIDDNGNGYGFMVSHNKITTKGGLYIDRRSSYGVPSYVGSIGGNDMSVKNTWRKATLSIGSDNSITATHSVPGSFDYTASGTDATTNSFSRIYIFGGFDYWIDDLRIRKKAPTEPVTTTGREMSTLISKGNAFGIGADRYRFYGFIDNLVLQTAIYPGWNHVVLTYDKDALNYQQKLYVNGELKEKYSHNIPIPINTDNFTIGKARECVGAIDEVALYNKALSADEIATHYRRGTMNVKFQVRSSVINPPTNDFIGPDGTNKTYYSELQNSSTSLPSLILNNVTDNPYFQYKAYLDTNSTTNSPEIGSVTIGPEHYPTTVPTITTRKPITGFSSLAQFSESLGLANQGSIEYQFSINGSDWYYHNGTSWVLAHGQTQTSTSSQVNANAKTFANEVGKGSLYVKMFLHSNGRQQIEFKGFSFQNTPYGAFSWYFAEGATTDPFDTWILIQNPNENEAQVQVTFTQKNAAPIVKKINIPSRRRYTIHLDDIMTTDEVSTFIQSLNDVGVIAERSMYWSTDGNNIWNGGHCSIGITQTQNKWYIAEGSTQNIDTYILLGNPNDQNSEATVTYTLVNGDWIQKTVSVPAKGRYTIHTNLIPELLDKEFSTIVEASLPIAVERAMYWDTDTIHWIGGTCSIASPKMSTEWYFAEGCTNNFDQFILISNPTENTAKIQYMFFTHTGRVVEKSFILGPMRRHTIHVNTIPSLESAYMSAIIKSTNSIGIVAERSMYWKEPPDTESQYYTDKWIGGHSTLGATTPATIWYLAEGSTRDIFSEWILIANPSDTEAIVEVTYMKEDSLLVGKTISIPPKTRYTIHANEDIYNDSFSTLVESTNNVKIVTERTMYWSATADGDNENTHWVGGHCSIGTQ